MIPDGFYEFTADMLEIFSIWPIERLRQLAEAIGAAREGRDPRAAVEETLTSDPDLGVLSRRLSPMRDARAFWGFIAVLLATITLLISQSDQRSPSVAVGE
jgi:hypothetical protein